MDVIRLDPQERRRRRFAPRGLVAPSPARCLGERYLGHYPGANAPASPGRASALGAQPAWATGFARRRLAARMAGVGYELTSAAERAACQARFFDRGPAGGRLALARLLHALAGEGECRAARLLAAAGIDRASIEGRWPELAASGLPSAPHPQVAHPQVTQPQATQPSAPLSPESLLSVIAPAGTHSPEATPLETELDASALHDPQWLALIDAAMGIFADHPQPLAIGTEHLLVALAALEHDVAEWLAGQGFSRAQAEAAVHHWHGLRPGPLELPAAEAEPSAAPLSSESLTGGRQGSPGATRSSAAERPDTASLDDEPLGEPLECEPAPPPEPPGATGSASAPLACPPLGATGSASAPDAARPRATGSTDALRSAVTTDASSSLTGTWRVIDAEANRAAEALRVVEDYVRFVLDDRQLTAGVKDLRHELGLVLQRLGPSERLAARETLADVGTTLDGADETERAGPAQVAVANWKRAEQALRSLAEFAKVVDPAAAAALEGLRYRAYTWERALQVTESARERLAAASLYVLIDGGASRGEFERLAGALVEAGVDVLQLRDKRLADRELVARARLLRRITAGSDTLLVMNDRPDLAVLAQADGVHVGQDELSVKDCRTIVGPRLLVGVSTHSLAEAQQAVLDGADYLGVGPVFPTPTKEFAAHPGVALLRAVADETRRPAFAIGGITADNLAAVRQAGFSRVAVSHSVLSAPDPAQAVRELRTRLKVATESTRV